MVVQGLGSSYVLTLQFQLPHRFSDLIPDILTLRPTAPMFWGTLSDRWGRRPMFIGCMVTLSLSCVGLALVPTHAYAGLMLLRCLQAFGSASTIALGACLRVYN